MADTAKVFWSGRSQAVRLPKEYRFDTDAVTIRRRGNEIVLEPLPRGFAEGDQPPLEKETNKPLADEWAWLKDFGPIDDDVIAAAEEEPEPQLRPELDDL